MRLRPLHSGFKQIENSHDHIPVYSNSCGPTATGSRSINMKALNVAISGSIFALPAISLVIRTAEP